MTTLNISSHVFLSIEAYVTGEMKISRFHSNRLLLTVSNYEISLFLWVRNKTLINQDLGPFGKYLL